MKAYKGETLKIELEYVNDLIQPKDMTGFEFKLVGKQDLQQPDAEFEVLDEAFDKAKAADGLIELRLTTKNISVMYYICQIIASNNDETVFTKVFSIEILQSII